MTVTNWAAVLSEQSALGFTSSTICRFLVSFLESGRLAVIRTGWLQWRKRIYPASTHLLVTEEKFTMHVVAWLKLCTKSAWFVLASWPSGNSVQNIMCQPFHIWKSIFHGNLDYVLLKLILESKLHWFQGFYKRYVFRICLVMHTKYAWRKKQQTC